MQIHFNKPQNRMVILGCVLTGWFAVADLACAETIMNKCTDGQKTTYTDKSCEKLGLTDAGPINNAAVEVVAIPGSLTYQNIAHAYGSTIEAEPKKPLKLLLYNSSTF